MFSTHLKASRSQLWGMGTRGSKEPAGLCCVVKMASQLVFKNKVESLRAMGLNLWALVSDSDEIIMVGSHHNMRIKGS